MADPKHPPGPPTTLGNCELGVQMLIASYLSNAYRHTTLIDVSGYPADTEMPSFDALAQTKSERCAAFSR
jgi:hypothetical protein